MARTIKHGTHCTTFYIKYPTLSIQQTVHEEQSSLYWIYIDLRNSECDTVRV